VGSVCECYRCIGVGVTVSVMAASSHFTHGALMLLLPVRAAELSSCEQARAGAAAAAAAAESALEAARLSHGSALAARDEQLRQLQASLASCEAALSESQSSLLDARRVHSTELATRDAELQALKSAAGGRSSVTRGDSPVAARVRSPAAGSHVQPQPPSQLASGHGPSPLAGGRSPAGLRASAASDDGVVVAAPVAQTRLGGATAAVAVPAAGRVTVDAGGVATAGVGAAGASAAASGAGGAAGGRVSGAAGAAGHGGVAVVAASDDDGDATRELELISERDDVELLQSMLEDKDRLIEAMSSELTLLRSQVEAQLQRRVDDARARALTPMSPQRPETLDASELVHTPSHTPSLSQAQAAPRPQSLSLAQSPSQPPSPWRHAIQMAVSATTARIDALARSPGVSGGDGAGGRVDDADGAVLLRDRALAEAARSHAEMLSLRSALFAAQESMEDSEALARRREAEVSACMARIQDLQAQLAVAAPAGSDGGTALTRIRELEAKERQLRAAIVSQSKELEDKEGLLLSLKAALSARDIDLHAKREQLDVVRAQLTSQSAAAEDRARAAVDEAASLRTAVSALTTQLAEQRQEHAAASRVAATAAAKELQDARTAAASSASECAGLRSRVRQLEEEVASASNAAASSASECAALRARVGQLEEALAAASTTASDEVTAQLRDAVTVRDGALERLAGVQQQLAAVRLELEQQRSRAAEAEAAKRDLDAHIASQVLECHAALSRSDTGGLGSGAMASPPSRQNHVWPVAVALAKARAVPQGTRRPGTTAESRDAVAAAGGVSRVSAVEELLHPGSSDAQHVPPRGSEGSVTTSTVALPQPGAVSVVDVAASASGGASASPAASMRVPMSPPRTPVSVQVRRRGVPGPGDVTPTSVAVGTTRPAVPPAGGTSGHADPAVEHEAVSPAAVRPPPATGDARATIAALVDSLKVCVCVCVLRLDAQ
jgi:hypothetical protein